MMTEDALEEMLGCCMREEVGVVGAKLLYAEQMNGMKNIAERRIRPLGLQTKPVFFSDTEKYD